MIVIMIENLLNVHACVCVCVCVCSHKHSQFACLDCMVTHLTIKTHWCFHQVGNIILAKILFDWCYWVTKKVLMLEGTMQLAHLIYNLPSWKILWHLWVWYYIFACDIMSYASFLGCISIVERHQHICSFIKCFVVLYLIWYTSFQENKPAYL